MQGSKLTRKLVEAARPREREYFVWDRDLKGFGLKVTEAGSKSFVVQYRLGGRGFPAKRQTIGRDGSPWNATTARDEAERILHLVGLGQDPAAVASARRHSQLHGRFEQFAQTFLDSYAKRNWAPRTFDTHRSNVERWLIPV
ncbi:MAG: Arm DNA-binding domain-containing protein, partial [Allopontixanthobacter sediminis]